MSHQTLTMPTVENLRKASRAVYLACEAPVADDISNLLKWAASQIEASAAVVTAACRLVAADTYVHPTLSRADAVKAADAELHAAVGRWHGGQPAVAASHIPQETAHD